MAEERTIPPAQPFRGFGRVVDVVRNALGTQATVVEAREEGSSLVLRLGPPRGGSVTLAVRYDAQEAAGRKPPLEVAAAIPVEGTRFVLRRYSLRSARTIFLWLGIHALAVIPIIFAIYDPLGIRRRPDPSGGVVNTLILISPLLALVGVGLVILFLTLGGWTKVAIITDRQGRATGDAWTARGDVAFAKRAAEDAAVVATLESRGVVEAVLEGNHLTLRAWGPRVTSRLSPGEERLVRDGFGQETVAEAQGRFAMALAAQLLDLQGLVVRFREVLSTPASPSSG